MDPHVANGLSAGLEAFFDDNTGAFQSCAGFFDNVDQSQKRTSIGEKIIDQKNIVPKPRNFLERMTSYTFLWVKDSTFVVYISPSG